MILPLLLSLLPPLDEGGNKVDFPRLESKPIEMNHGVDVSALAFLSPYTLLTGGFDGKLRVWSLDEEKTLSIIDVQAKPISSLAVSPDRKYAATTDEKGVTVLESGNSRMSPQSRAFCG